MANDGRSSSWLHRRRNAHDNCVKATPGHFIYRVLNPENTANRTDPIPFRTNPENSTDPLFRSFGRVSSKYILAWPSIRWTLWSLFFKMDIHCSATTTLINYIIINGDLSHVQRELTLTSMYSSSINACSVVENLGN